MSDPNPPGQPPTGPAGQPPAVPAGWTPVVPQPPGAPGAGPTRAVRAAAMVLGLGALLTTVIAALYLPLLAVLGAVLGIAGVVLGVVVLATRPRPAVAAGAESAAGGASSGPIAVAGGVGIGGGALALVGALTLGAVTLMGAVVPFPHDPDPGTVPPPGDSAAGLEWPQNMGSGGIRFDERLEAVRGPAVSAGTAPLAPTVDREAGPVDIQLYVDYRCPHCVQMETANGETIAGAVRAGAASLELRAMSFVSPVSPMLAGAVACVADAQPERAWEAHRALLDPSTQRISTEREIADALDSALGGLEPQTRSCVERGRFVDFAAAVSSWISANPVPNALDPGLRVQGTPLVVVGGEPYTGQPDDADAFSAFLRDRGVDLD